MSYKIYYDSFGNPSMIIRESDGAALPYNLETRKFDESSDLVIELRQWESANQLLDLSNKPPDTDLVNAKLTAASTLNQIASQRQSEAIDKYFPALRDIWHSRLQDATQFLSLNILQLNDANTPRYLKQELFASGKQVTIATLRSLAQEVQTKAEAYRMESAYINGKLTKKRLEVEALTDVQKAISYPVYEGWD